MKFLFLLGLVLASAHGAQVTPVQQVINLLNDMVAKGVEEKRNEEKQWSRYKNWCENTTGRTQREIEDNEDSIQKLTVSIAEESASIKQLTKEIQKHNLQNDYWNGDLEASTKIRNIEKSQYDATSTDLRETLKALSMAKDVLKAESGDTAQASLLQIAEKASTNQTLAKAILSAEAQLQQPGVAHGYEFQSQGIIDLFDQLSDKFSKQLADVEQQEEEHIHHYNMLQSNLKTQVQHMEARIASKTKTKGDTIKSKGSNEQSLAESTSDRDINQKYYTETSAECASKAGDFKSRQQLRADELVAVKKAIEILGGAAVSGGSEKHLPQMLFQLRSKSDGLTDAQQKVASFLRIESDRLNSRVLSTLATQAVNDPFGKVKKLINDLITRLMEEATNETEHKGWCDTELSQNKITRDEKTSQMELLQADIESLSADVQQLTEEIAELTEQIADLNQDQAEATKLRLEESAENKQTIKDAKAAQAAVSNAVSVLNDFYAKSAEATALIQAPKEKTDAPEIFDESYKGMGESGGVIAMLEVIQSDFTRLETKTQQEEESAQYAYDQQSHENKVSLTEKATILDQKQNTKQSKASALQRAENDHNGTRKELDAAKAYFEKLKPSCIDQEETFAERVSRREEEIQSLKEALKILQDRN